MTRELRQFRTIAEHSATVIASLRSEGKPSKGVNRLSQESELQKQHIDQWLKRYFRCVTA